MLSLLTKGSQTCNITFHVETEQYLMLLIIYLKEEEVNLFQEQGNAVTSEW